MRLGSLDLRRTALDEWTARTLQRAIESTDEPARSLVVLSALALSVEGPPDWPRHPGALDYDAFGLRVKGYLLAHGIDLSEAYALGIMAVRAIRERPVAVTDARVVEMADFFGVTLPGSTSGSGASSPTATAETPSAG